MPSSSIMSLGDSYLHEVLSLLQRVKDTNAAIIAEVAQTLAESVRSDRICHLFGSGHSAILAREAINRAGGLVQCSQIVDPTNGWAETLPGYGEKLMEHHRRHYPMQEGEIVFVFSNSGINPSPIDVAAVCRQAGLRVVAITSLEMSRNARSRHPSGKRLFELADWVLDNLGQAGDAAISLPGSPLRVGPTSTFSGAMLIQLVLLETIGILHNDSVDLPILQSVNIPGGRERNQQLLAKYRGRICWPV